MYKIAICDDDKNYREKIEKVIETEGILPKSEIRFYEYESGKELLKNADILHDLVFMDIDDLNFDSKVDIIIANGVLNNAKHIDSTFEKMINLVRPGGKIFIIEQVAESLEILVSQVFMMEDIDNSTESETFRSVEEWKRIFNNDRIEKVEVYPDMHFIEQRLFIISCN